MWISRYPCTMDITYDQELEFLDQEFKNTLIHNERDIGNKPATVGNLQDNSIIKLFHHFLGGVISMFKMDKCCIDENYPWKGILVSAAFYVFLFYTTPKQSPVKLVPSRDMVVTIEHIEN